MVSYELLKSSFSFENFLKQFSEEYKSGERSKIEKHIHPFVKLVSTYKPGLYCVEGRPKDLPSPEYIMGDYIISSEEPDGDFCEGYKGSRDGMYYEFFDEAHDLFPRVYDMNGEGTERMLFLTEDVIYRYFAKVTVITEEHFNRNLYFFNEQDRWYFWVEDFCDCSL
jgi:hypothetical protein